LTLSASKQQWPIAFCEPGAFLTCIFLLASTVPLPQHDQFSLVVVKSIPDPDSCKLATARLVVCGSKESWQQRYIFALKPVLPTSHEGVGGEQGSLKRSDTVVTKVAFSV
jgi:hypothetical protein